VTWEEGALSDGEGNGGEMRRGDVLRGLVKRLQRIVPRAEDGRPGKVRARGFRLCGALRRLSGGVFMFERVASAVSAQQL